MNESHIQQVPASNANHAMLISVDGEDQDHASADNEALATGLIRPQSPHDPTPPSANEASTKPEQSGAPKDQETSGNKTAQKTDQSTNQNTTQKPKQTADQKTDPNASAKPSDNEADGTKSASDANNGPQGNKTPEKEAKPREVLEPKVKLQKALPKLEDDGDVGSEKEHIVTRDGKSDLAFLGILKASAAPDSAPKGKWEEYRIYETSGNKHVFSKVTRTIFADESDTFVAEVFDPTPPSTTSKLLRTALEVAHAKPYTWMDAAVKFFGYDPLAKTLYRKLDVRFEEQIS